VLTGCTGSWSLMAPPQIEDADQQLFEFSDRSELRTIPAAEQRKIDPSGTPGPSRMRVVTQQATLRSGRRLMKSTPPRRTAPGGLGAIPKLSDRRQVAPSSRAFRTYWVRVYSA